jgi:exonuclease III
MRIISWNCRGLVNGPAVRGLLDVQKRMASDILFFLTEIKHDKKWMEWFRWKLEMPNMVAKSSKRTNGGLAMFWRRVLISM